MHSELLDNIILLILASHTFKYPSRLDSQLAWFSPRNGPVVRATQGLKMCALNKALLITISSGEQIKPVNIRSRHLFLDGN